MGFTTALSGLNSAQNMLSVTGNNIANANTAGFKQSRSEFADVYATSLGGVSSTTPGSGSKVANVAQQFDQGNLEFTKNSLDLAISGEGFFVLADNVQDINTRVYTRAGNFHVDKDGYVVNNTNNPLLVFQPNGTTVQEGFSQGILQPLQISTSQGIPEATANISISVNLDASAPLPALPFDPTTNPPDTDSYNYTASINVFDSLGDTHTLSSYYVKTAVNSWNVYTYFDGAALDFDPTTPAVADPSQLEFNGSGAMVTVGVPLPATDNPISFTGITLTNGADPMALTVDYTGSTQFSESSSVNLLTQDGLTVGRLIGIDIDTDGVVFARFSNGAAQTMGQVALMRFPNPQGLSKLGDTTWAQSAGSGAPIPGAANTGNFGAIQSGALENSNVDLAEQLVKLIIAQQYYQANAQTITTENQITQTLINIR
ncbi:MAG TPA: flagellar hook protein FlgE [Methylococcaceae bacterium]|nr:flagellar hook protein FlgE [Methylococcaceae bacterium]